MTFILPDADDIDATIALCKEFDDFVIAQQFGIQHASAPNLNWDFLEQIFKIHLRPRNATEPFGAMLISNGSRTMIPNDLSDEQLDSLQETLVQVKHKHYQARVGDILWQRRKDYKSAQIAVDAYIESGKAVEDPDKWVSSMDRYERAIRLASTLGKGNVSFRKAIDHILERARYYDGTDGLWFTHHALTLLYEFHQGDPMELGGLAAKVAERARAKADFRRAWEHHHLEAKFYRRAGDEARANQALTARAERIADEADAREAAGTFSAAHSFWNDAIQAYRLVPDSRERVLELHQRMNIAGQKMLHEFKPIETEFDISELAEGAKALIEGKSAQDSLCILAAFVCNPIDPVELRKQVEEMLKTTPLQAVVPASIYDAAGRKVGIRPSAMTGDPEQYENAIQGFMVQHADLHRGIAVAGSIAPAIRQLLSENIVDEAIIKELIDGSPFVPADRMSLFVRGIRHGFEWDFSTAIHLLIPQVENSLRILLAGHGIITTSLDAVGIEETWPLGKILSHPTMKEILGEDHLFELRTLLLGQPGSNIRNLLAHGLLNGDRSNNQAAFYLWWLVFRLTVLISPAFSAFIERSQTQPEK